MNRGSGRDPRVRVPIPPASMRPRFMNRGSAGNQTPSQVHSIRFNEAPIHESGKCFLVSTGVGSATRFNEAPIHESGKCGQPTR